MAKVINFLAQNDHVWNVRPKPFPAAKGLPDWWKNIPVYSSGHQGKLELDPMSNVTVKRCVPTLDILTSGYYVPLWADLFVTQQEGLPFAKWTVKTPVAECWPDYQVSLFEIPEGFSKLIFKNLHGWTIKTPPGWSCLFIHPQAYPKLPFYTISGIVDTDIFDGEINVPFVIKEGFEGIIERNTPMFQIIPFKREKWDSTFDVKKTDGHFFDNEKIYSRINRAYNSMLKDKKIYR
jgi:hypothetical protein